MSIISMTELNYSVKIIINKKLNTFMRLNDKTLQSNYLRRIKQLINEYELIKQKKHTRFVFVEEFYRHHKITKQNFIKYYNRFKLGNMNENELLPQKRGRKFGTLKTIPFIREKILELRNQGFGRYEIFDFILPKYGKYTPSPSTIYNILKSKGLSKLDPRMIQTSKRKIIKNSAGELGHMDCHRLAKGIIESNNDNLFLLTLTDDYTRLAFSIVIENLTSITVALNTQKLLAVFNKCYDINFYSIMTDNGSEFGSKATKQETKDKHPFESILKDLNIKHIYTRPYKPQTNGKVERYWRSIEDELLRDQIYKDKDNLLEEIFEYCIYYNHVRRHQGINNITPYTKLITPKINGDSVTE